MITINHIQRIYPTSLNNGQSAIYVELRDGSTCCLAVPSWHTDYDSLLSAPPIHDHRANWLRVCGYQTPDEPYSAEATEALRATLSHHEAQILEHLKSEKGWHDEAFWSSLWPPQLPPDQDPPQAVPNG